MGKKKAKRVKKAWRSISTADIDEFTEKSAKDALSGGSVSSLPSDSLFFVDTSTDAPLKRKIEKHREKMLRCDSILQKNPFVQAVPSSVQKKSKRVQQASALEQQEQLGSSTKEDAGKEAGLFDIWDDQGGSDVKSKKPKAKPSLIPAVEAEPPGCSYNPDDESHKDSLARAVAEEMKKVYRSELGPQPVPLTVPGEAIGEEDRYFLDVNDEGEDDMDEENQSENGDDALGKRTVKEKRVTRVEQNRRVRHKEQMRAELEAKKAEQLSKEIDSIDDIIQEIDQEDEEKQKRHLRRVVAKQERLKSCPPRLGKRKFEPAPLQVLLSEEITGSLRKLKACCTLARDRFKSLEKRGLIVPSAKSSRR